ncbi:MAG: hypothetical protein WC683_16115 [bacterium]
MRIRIPTVEELNGPRTEPKPGWPTYRLSPGLENCEVTDDDGKPLTMVKSIDIRMRCGEPIVATIERFDVSGDITAIQAERGPDPYAEGNRHALIQMAGHLIAELGATESTPSLASLMLRAQKERLETVSALRRLCARHGDNDWPDDLYLPDVIEKHIPWGATVEALALEALRTIARAVDIECAEGEIVSTKAIVDRIEAIKVKP